MDDPNSLRAPARNTLALKNVKRKGFFLLPDQMTLQQCLFFCLGWSTSLMMVVFYEHSTCWIRCETEQYYTGTYQHLRR